MPAAVQITAASLPSGDPSPPAPRGELDPASPASGVLSSQIRTGVAGTSTGLGRHGPEGIIEQDRHETTDANFLRLFPDSGEVDTRIRRNHLIDKNLRRDVGELAFAPQVTAAKQLAAKPWQHLPGIREEPFLILPQRVAG